eukprot:SM000026S09010  [mRNA]  locus=s26:915149:923348:- [translate_table: standard]
MKKRVDMRILTLVENGVRARHRSMFVIVGDRGRDQVVNLHYLLSKSVVKARPSVLWCYKKELYLSSHWRKRQKEVRKMKQQGKLDPEKEDPFALFVASTNIRYCYYSDTHKILGNTFGMCVLQDFEALTPNLLARTVEAVEGGGIIVLLLSSLTSLSKLYTMTMDVHARFRTESHTDVTGRFNERFILSLANCRACVVMDDELNILPISSHIRNLQPHPKSEVEESTTEAEQDLKELKESLKDTQPMGALVDKCRTLDQAKAVITFLDAISEKTLRSTVALTAARGRGKSAALGVAIAGAIALGYSNIFVTSPSPENLRTLFDFICKGFDAMDYKEHIDYDLVESTNPTFNKAIIRMNVFRQHRQTVQYIQPQHSERLAQAELLVVDEAAAIPLPIVKALLGPYLIFLCSTVNGYEGTGRSLSLKLIQQLKEQAQKSTAGAKQGEGAASGRVFKEVQLAEPIRYAPGDPIEAWLNSLLCLSAANHVTKLSSRLPHPNECDLFYVNRDTLFSHHRASEEFLQRTMALYVASHYKNTPNDLQLMSDAPAHHLFVLLGPVHEDQSGLPDILCVVQVCLEGDISRQSAQQHLAQGYQPTGDLIPWTVSQQFQDAEFPSLSGARIVRIATHPDLVRAGYGSRAVDLLARYYEGQLTSLEEDGLEENSSDPTSGALEAAKEVGLQEEQVKPRANLPPLLVGLRERRAEQLHYLGASFGLTQSLFAFWRKQRFHPVYLRQTPNEITGEHTTIVLRPLQNDEVESGPGTSGSSWLHPFSQDFKRRMTFLLGYSFRNLPPALALSLLDPKISFTEQEAQSGVVNRETIFKGSNPLLTPYDLKRLESYARNLVDYHMILDLLPTIARLYFLERLPTTLSYGQAAILLCLGLQHQQLTDVEQHLKLPSNQILALFNKTVRKLHSQLHAAAAMEVELTLPRMKEVTFVPHDATVEEDLDEGARKVKMELKEKMKGLLDPAGLQQFAISGRETEFEEALLQTGGKVAKSGLLSVKGKTRKGEGKGEKSDKKHSVNGVDKKRKSPMEGPRRSKRKASKQ